MESLKIFPHHPQHDDLLQHITAIANVMDGEFKIFGFGFGIDAVIGLVPGLGDILGGIVSLYIVYRAREFTLPQHVYDKMLRNIMIDVFVGSIPLLGDIFDFFFTVNQKNLQLLQDELVLKRQ